ncbi:hypothetical protein G9A89_000158 [Geosiphon pyriformis]|nr:hypothetical protein G9A89_000158 [Geosiphon pyriformis]
MPCNDKWCPKCYAFSIPLPSKNDQEEIEFEKPKTKKKLQQYQSILLKTTHELDAEYNLRYSGKDTLVLQPKSLTKINLKIALEIPPEAIIQIAS